VKKLAMEAGISESAVTQVLSAVQKPSITAGTSTSDTHLFEPSELPPTPEYPGLRWLSYITPSEPVSGMGSTIQKTANGFRPVQWV
jgi:hypothetical protein